MTILAQSAPKAQVPGAGSAPEFQASREGYKSLATLVGPGILPLKAGEVQPLFFRLAHMTGFKSIPGGGMWLNCQFRYEKPGGRSYVVEAACAFDYRVRATGAAYIRSCSCPDGLARAGQKGEMRKCKHMLALAAHVAGRVGTHANIEPEKPEQPCEADFKSAADYERFQADREEEACEAQAARDEFKRSGSRFE